VDLHLRRRLLPQPFFGLGSAGTMNLVVGSVTMCQGRGAGQVAGSRAIWKKTGVWERQRNKTGSSRSACVWFQRVTL
jgi:hypothetical protein